MSLELVIGTKWNQSEEMGGCKLLKTWWPGTELNRRRRPFQGRALPTELPGQSFLIVGSAPESVKPPKPVQRRLRTAKSGNRDGDGSPRSTGANAVAVHGIQPARRISPLREWSAFFTLRTKTGGNQRRSPESTEWRTGGASADFGPRPCPARLKLSATGRSTLYIAPQTSW